jgi:hypothetical protein
MRSEYVDKHWEGDHICYISDLSKMKSHYPKWNVSKTLDDIFEDLHEAELAARRHSNCAAWLDIICPNPLCLTY